MTLYDIINQDMESLSIDKLIILKRFFTKIYEPDEHGEFLYNCEDFYNYYVNYFDILIEMKKEELTYAER